MIDNILDRKIENEINLFEIELDNYCENAIREMNEADQLYTEGSGDILGKIKEKIELIFQKIASLFAKGNMSLKSREQQNAINTIAKEIKRMPIITIKIPNVWEFSDTMDKLIKERVEKFDRKNSLEFFLRNHGERKAIDNLIKCLDGMTSQLHDPSNKAFYTKTNVFRKIGGVAFGTLGAVETGAVGMASVAIANGDVKREIERRGAEEAKKALSKPFTTFRATVNGKEVSMNNVEYSAAVLKATKEMSVFVGKYGPLLAAGAGAAALILLLATVYILKAGFKKKIEAETVTTVEILKRIEQMAPAKFPSMLSTTSNKVKDYMKNVKNLEAFANNNTDGTIGMNAVTYSQKISKLLISYGNFHQAMIDYYMSILSSIIARGMGVNKSKLYHPNCVWNFE